MKKFCIFALVAMLFAACTTDDTQDLRPMNAPETLTVGFEEDTRIQLNETQKTIWTENDLVSVFYRSNANQKWQYQGKTGERIGTLEQVLAGNATDTMQRVVVVYPYNENYYINTETYNVEATLPATQHYLKDSYGLDGNIMISSGEYNQISLKNVCGWLKVQLTGNGEVVKSISLKGNNLEQVAGQIYINSADATATLASEMGAADDGENSAGGNLVFEDTIIKEVTLDCGEGVTLGEEPTAFYIALPPQTFEKGLTIEVVTTEGKAMGQCTDKQIAIERNSIQPMAALAFEEKIAANKIYYTSSDGRVVRPYKTDLFGASVVSNTYENGQGVITFDGKVTEIGVKAFYNRSKLSSITIPNSVTSIGELAFSHCSSLTSLTIPDSITEIGKNAFSHCSSLTSIAIPDNVTTIGERVFGNCSSLTSITIPNSVTEIGKSAFNGCSSLTNITIPNSVNSIGGYAFQLCSNLASITIPGHITEIGEGAFKDCDNLDRINVQISDLATYCTSNIIHSLQRYVHLFIDGQEITELVIPNGVTSIGDYTLFACSSLTSITIPNSVNSIGEGAFYYCGNLTGVTIPDSVTKIGVGAFQGCGSLTTITIPDGVTEIGKGAFYFCSKLTSVTISGSATLIGEAAFACCLNLTAFNGEFASEDNRCLIVNGVLNSFAPAGLTSYTIPDSVTSIGNQALKECLYLTTITIPDSVTKIGVGAFAWCRSLTSITIPDSVTEIGEKAFLSCSSMKTLYCKSTTPPSLGEYALYNYTDSPTTPLGCIIYVPASDDDSVINAYKAASGWSDYASYIFEEGALAIHYTATENLEMVFYDVCNANVVSHEWDSATGKGVATFDGEITMIKDYAFCDCNNLTSVTIPDSVNDIGKYAFLRCGNLTTMTIPDSVNSIGEAAFANCGSLTSITIPDSVNSIGKQAFVNCSSLASVTIGNNVSQIEYGAFSNCSSLKDVYCKPTTPPNLGTRVFDIFTDSIPAPIGCNIYVPASDDDSIINAYKAKQYWSDYADYIVEYGFSAEQ